MGFSGIAALLGVLASAPTGEAATGWVRVEFLGFTPEGGWASLETNPQGEGRLHVRGPGGREEVHLGEGAALAAASQRQGLRRPSPRRPGQRLPDGTTIELEARAFLGRPRPAALILRREEDRVILVELPSEGSVELGDLWLAPDQRSAILELRLGHQPGLIALDLLSGRGKLEVVAALRAARAGAIEEATARLERAVEVAPQLGEPYYDLACLHTLLGDLERAADELRLALAIDAGRFGRLAEKDPDLDALRASEELWASLELGD